MSYEGFVQRWCLEGHYWTTPETYEKPPSENRICPQCGKSNVAANTVDDTNCEAHGKLGITDRLPTVKEMQENRDATYYWHRDMAFDFGWLETIEKSSPEDQKYWWVWVVEGM